MDFRKIQDTFAALVIDRTDPDDNSTEAQQIRDRLKALLPKIEAVRGYPNR
jgi:hypothetical protein